MKEYKLAYLNDQEFEALSLVNPRYVNTKDDFGFADMITNRIFVRKTGNSIVDQFVTNHEIEEILAKNSEHQDEFNIRHKKGGALRTILPIAAAFVPVVGPLLSAGLNIGLNQAAQARHPEELGKPSIGSALVQGASGFLGGKAAGAVTEGAIKGGTAAAPGLLSKAAGIAGGAGKGAMGALGFGTPAPAATATTPGALYGAGTPVGTINTGTFSQFPAGYTAAPATFAKTAASMAIPVGQMAGTTAAMPAAQNLGFQTPSTPKVGLAAGAPQSGVTQGQQGLITPSVSPGATAAGTTSISGATGAGAEVAKKTGMLGKLLGENWRQTVLGASIPMVGNMFTKPMFPEGSENVPFTPEQSQLFQETREMIKQGPNVQLQPAQKQAITVNFDDALEQARQNIMDRYKALRPGSDIENDSQFREAMIELESDFAEKKANALAGAQLGLGAQQTAMMGELANMEIGSLALRAGIQWQEAKAFKDMLAQAGFMVATAGQPVIYSGR